MTNIKQYLILVASLLCMAAPVKALPIDEALDIPSLEINYQNNFENKQFAAIHFLGYEGDLSFGNSKQTDTDKNSGVKKCKNEGYNVIGTSCATNSGYFLSGRCPYHSNYYKACINCSAYTLSACPASTNCSKCQNGKFKIDSCQTGYKLEGSTCVYGCDDYPLTSCPANSASCTNCPYDGARKKLASCNSGYAVSGNSCTCVPATPSGYQAANNCKYGVESTKQDHCGRTYYKCNACTDTCNTGTKNTCTIDQTTSSTSQTQCGTTCYVCQDKPKTCRSWADANGKSSGITWSDNSNAYYLGTLRGPATLDYDLCKAERNPVLTVNNSSGGSFDVDHVDIVFKVPNESVDSSCKNQFNSCRDRAADNGGSYGQSRDEIFCGCMEYFVNSSISCYFPYSYPGDASYDSESNRFCATRNWYDYSVAGTAKIKNSKITTSQGITTAFSRGTVELYDGANVQGTIDASSYNKDGSSVQGGTIIAVSGNSTVTSPRAYRTAITVRAGSVMNSLSSYGYQGMAGSGDGILDSTHGYHIYGLFKVATLTMTNGPIKVYNGGILDIGSISASNDYRARIYWDSGAEIKIGSTCVRMTSSGNRLFTSNTSSNPLSGTNCRY